MDRYGPVADSEKRKARLAGMAKLPPIGVFMAMMMILPLLIIAGFAAHYGLDGSEAPWRVVASLLALPYFSLLLYAGISGLRDPFWPAAMRKKLDEAKAGTA